MLGAVMKIAMSGATGLTGGFFLDRLSRIKPQTEVTALVRESSDRHFIETLPLKINYHVGDIYDENSWDKIFQSQKFDAVLHLAHIRATPSVINSLKRSSQAPRLIVIGTTGCFSKYNQYSQMYVDAEACFHEYEGSYCLVRPTMIYGSSKDLNLHKLIKFCNKFGFFPVFGSGQSLLQPIHADDIAQVLLSALEKSQISGNYNLSGGTVISFEDLITLVEKILDKPIRKVFIPLGISIKLASISEKVLQSRSPIKKEQVLRLQEDKVFSSDKAMKDLDFSPRTLEDGLRQEVQSLQDQKII
jgi:nucleoside-diphosphate-sugar epimerase